MPVPARSAAELQTQLRIHARGAYPDHFQAARLNRYAVSRGPRLGPVGENFGAACHQIDRADRQLALSWGGKSILDATTANIALFVIAGHAGEREAHLREVQQHAQDLPEGSYGRANRQAIATRETRIATRLRAVEHAYRTATEHDTTLSPLEPTRTLRPNELQAGREIDMEAEP